jgi:hypothetical protein
MDAQLTASQERLSSMMLVRAIVLLGFQGLQFVTVLERLHSS